MMPGLSAVNFPIKSGVAIVSPSAPIPSRRKLAAKKSASELLPRFASASRRVIKFSPGLSASGPALKSETRDSRRQTDLILQQLPQYVFQDPAVTVVIHFRRRIDTANHFELGHLAVIGSRLNGQFLSQLEPRTDTQNIEGLKAGKIVRFEIFSRLENHRHDSHADQIAAMNTFETLGNGGLDTEKPRPLCCPVAR